MVVACANPPQTWVRHQAESPDNVAIYPIVDRQVLHIAEHVPGPAVDILLRCRHAVYQQERHICITGIDMGDWIGALRDAGRTNIDVEKTDGVLDELMMAAVV